MKLRFPVDSKSLRAAIFNSTGFSQHIVSNDGFVRLPPDLNISQCGDRDTLMVLKEARTKQRRQTTLLWRSNVMFVLEMSLGDERSVEEF